MRVEGVGVQGLLKDNGDVGYRGWYWCGVALSRDLPAECETQFQWRRACVYMLTHWARGCLHTHTRLQPWTMTIALLIHSLMLLVDL